MKQLHDNRIIDTWMKGSLVFVATHLVILAFMAIQQQSLTPFNVFFILDLHVFFPQLLESALSTMFSALIVVGVFGFFYYRRVR